jgi:hypothetical protein
MAFCSFLSGCCSETEVSEQLYSIKVNLCKKDFAESNTDHKVFWFYIDGIHTSIRTKFSHSANEVDDNLIHLMAKPDTLNQRRICKVCNLSNKQTGIYRNPKRAW